jgi:hypothetical protein
MLSLERKDLLLTMETIIGSQCYNGNIQNYGPYGVWEGEGRGYRYPINFISKENEKVKVRSTKYRKEFIFQDDLILTGIYQFGANSIAIMSGLNKVLNYLEDRYNIDFNELEKSIEDKDS